MMRLYPLHRRILIACVGSAILIGCESTPPARVDSYETTKEERYGGGPNISSMLQFSDQVAEQLAQDIAQIPEFQSAPTKLVLSLGDINNKSGTPTTDYELLQRRIRSKILNSRLLRDRFIVIEDRYRVQRQMDRQLDTANPPDVQRYDPKVTYLLFGDFYEANREGRRQYFFSFSLTGLSSSAIVFERSYDLGQPTVN